MILDEIVAHQRRHLARRRDLVPMRELEAMAGSVPDPREFVRPLRCHGVALIAETKRASPSKGLLCPDYRPLDLARAYAANGAAAISVLTESHFFGGSLDDLAEIRRGLEVDIPLLRKDFILEPYQVYEARAFGADAVLLIAAVLGDGVLGELLSLVRELGMAALVEVHDEEELERVLPLEPRVVGINNRDLRDFSVDLETFGRLRALVPDDVVAVAESGVRSAADVGRLAQMGADAVLVGEALVTAPDPGARVRDLTAGGGA